MSDKPDKKILRLDDFGASARLYERHASGRRRFFNFFPFFGSELLGSWAPFRELTVPDLLSLCDTLERHRIQLLFCVTATFFDGYRWVGVDEAYPNHVEVIKSATARGTLVLANHGLTHCKEEDSRSTGRHFWGNRSLHREYMSNRTPERLRNSLVKSQLILERVFGTRPKVLVPPGHAVSSLASQFCNDVGITHIATGARHDTFTSGNLTLMSQNDFQVLHTRDLVLNFDRSLESIVERGSSYAQISHIGGIAKK